MKKRRIDFDIVDASIKLTSYTYYVRVKNNNIHIGAYYFLEPFVNDIRAQQRFSPSRLERL